MIKETRQRLVREHVEEMDQQSTVLKHGNTFKLWTGKLGATKIPEKFCVTAIKRGILTRAR